MSGPPEARVIDSDGILALASAVHMYIKLHLSPQQRNPRSLSELLAACAALPVSRHPDDVAVLHNAYTIQQVVQTEFRKLQQLGYELATLTCQGSQIHQHARLGLPQWCDQQFKKPLSILFFRGPPYISLRRWASKCISGFLSVGVQRVLRTPQLHGRVTQKSKCRFFDRHGTPDA